MAETLKDSCNSNDCCSTNDNFERSDKYQIREDNDTINNSPECAVCLQTCIHPACLPCNHIFCYLCVKGVANQSKRCPMCRQEIPADFLDHPQLLQVDESQQMATAVDAAENSTQEEYQWFYEGRNGWWQYDQRTNLELETAYKQNKQSCELLIAGFLYIADFNSMFQLRRNDHSRRRRIKRDVCNAPKKGIAGLRLNNPVNHEPSDHQQQRIIREIRGAEEPVNSSNNDERLADETMSSRNLLHVPSEETQNNGTYLSTTSNVGQALHSDAVRQVFQHMHSGVMRENLTAEQHYLENIDNSVPFSNNSVLSWLHQAPNTIYPSDQDYV